ncbi:MAG: hypothetical protein LKF80_05525 [Brevundimonas sp.]|jgi:hypothetical protein|uniref:hypothetical protein n=1 Tax=Brevundimonas sp. TaxID=1871086 RepID=UPI0025B8333B|nr:hypothetical protein [Brevundimonas sp.]MCH4267844.1 hypothetical protein [Brevundimonas sp.]
MTGRGRGTDRHLAAAFCDNARSFRAMARHQQVRCGSASPYYLAIAIELGLKAYLLHRGITDQWNRDHVRHDLTKALKCVRRAGLRDVPEGIHQLVEVLSPLYASGALSWDLASPAMPLAQDAADQAISDLLAVVESVIGQERRSGG